MLFSLLPLLSLITLAASLPSLPHARAGPTPSFVLVGDSTVYALKTDPNSGGWGVGFCNSLTAGIFCSNHAHNGATTATIKTLGDWALALTDVKNEAAKGKLPIVLIQFGHNDMKVAAASWMATNLSRMVKEVSAAGGHAVLVTSLSRRNYKKGVISDTLGPWSDATKSVGTATSTPVLDLHATSIKYLNSIGEKAARRLDKVAGDATHLNPPAGLLFGRMVADLFKANALTGIPKFDSPIIADAARTTAISQGKQFIF